MWGISSYLTSILACCVKRDLTSLLASCRHRGLVWSGVSEVILGVLCPSLRDAASAGWWGPMVATRCSFSIRVLFIPAWEFRHPLLCRICRHQWRQSSQINAMWACCCANSQGEGCGNKYCLPMCGITKSRAKQNKHHPKKVVLWFLPQSVDFALGTTKSQPTLRYVQKGEYFENLKLEGPFCALVLFSNMAKQKTPSKKGVSLFLLWMCGLCTQHNRKKLQNLRCIPTVEVGA